MNDYKICITTLGCKVNQYESHTFENYFKDKGLILVSMDEPADIIIINTCAVTMQATRKSRQLIRQARRKNPNAFIIIIGCLAQLTETQEQLKNDVDVFLGSENKSSVVDIVTSFITNKEYPINKDSVTDVSKATEFDEMPSYANGSRVRSEVKIQDGCEQFCSYCLIPYMRGPERSRLPENVISEVKHLVEQGYREIVLTGIHLGAYGKNLHSRTDLASLCKQVLKETKLERLRLSSVEPNDITDELISLMASSNRIAPHLHLPLQGGSNKLLKDMNRRYTMEEYKAMVKRIRYSIPNIALTTDIIIGFPGETEEDFKKTIENIKVINYSDMHIFRFSPRPGTVAAKMKNQIHGDIAKLRSEKIRETANEMKDKYHKDMIGKEYNVLIEKYEDGKSIGHAENYVKVEINGLKLEKNILVKVQIISANTYCAQGIML